VPGSGGEDLEDILKEKNVIDSVEANEVKAGKEKAAAPVLPSLPDWLSKVTFNGDMRLRNELFLRKGDPDRNRDRLRLRFVSRSRPTTKPRSAYCSRAATAAIPSPTTRPSPTPSRSRHQHRQRISEAEPGQHVRLEPALLHLMGGKFYTPTYTATNLMFDRDLTPKASSRASSRSRPRTASCAACP